jgi:thymidylate synthase
MAFVRRVRNVGDALNALMETIPREAVDLKHEDSPWRVVSPRGLETIEWKGVFITEYEKPDERVLFSKTRDANPFFHFFESLWILAGREDVEFLAQFNPKMRDFSDDGIIFHGAYGERLRHHQTPGDDVDQILEAIEILKGDHDSRQIVLQIWNATYDLGTKTKDLPCNDLVFLKIRDGKLNITVCCRSNDAIWGAYGANAVQFSMIQEFIARSVGVGIGTYVQISDSFHIYTNNDAYQRLLKEPYSTDLYDKMTTMRPYPIMQIRSSPTQWLQELEYFIQDPNEASEGDPFFAHVAVPIWESWCRYKEKDYDKALKVLEDCAAYDWATACQQWIERRMEKKAVV